jgi:hypothetical protein
VFVSMGGLSARAAMTYLTATAATADVSDDVAATGAASTASYGSRSSPAHLVERARPSSSASGQHRDVDGEVRRRGWAPR